MAAEYISRGQFFRNPLLARVDERGLGRRRLDAGDVVGFDGVAEHDAHARVFAGTRPIVQAVFAVLRPAARSRRCTPQPPGRLPR